MIYELRPDGYEAAADLFDALGFCLSIRSVLLGLNPGRVYADSPSHPRAAMALSAEGIFCGGDPGAKGFLKSLTRVLREDVFTAAIARGAVQYTVFLPPFWEEAAAAVFAPFHPMPEERRYLEHRLEASPASANGDTLPVDADLLRGRDLAGLDDVRQEIEKGWGAAENFLARGFGRVAPVDGTIASWCLTDCVSDDRCELGVETDAAYRKQGFGLRVVAAMLADSRARGLHRVGWHCWTSNLASRRLALRAGFREEKTVGVLFGWYDQIVNLLINGNHYLLKIKDYEKSYTFYSKAFAHGYGWPWHYYNAACAAWRAGRQNEARRCYEQALDKGWPGLAVMYGDPHYDFMYTEPDAAEIEKALAKP